MEVSTRPNTAPEGLQTPAGVNNNHVHQHPRRQQNFTLSKSKALEKKESACLRPHQVAVQHTNGGTRIHFQSGLYEIFKAAVASKPVGKRTKEYSISSDGDVDNKGHEYTTRYRATQRDSNQAAFTVNLYHSTTSVLVNGTQYSFYCEILQSIGSVNINGTRISARTINQTILGQIQAAKHPGSSTSSSHTIQEDHPLGDTRSLALTSSESSKPACGSCNKQCATRFGRCTICRKHFHFRCAKLDIKQINRVEVDPKVMVCHNCCNIADAKPCPRCTDYDHLTGEDLEMLECSTCEGWLHKGCITITKDEWKAVTLDDAPYTCSQCSEDMDISAPIPASADQAQGPTTVDTGPTSSAEHLDQTVTTGLTAPSLVPSSTPVVQSVSTVTPIASLQTLPQRDRTQNCTTNTVPAMVVGVPQPEASDNREPIAHDALPNPSCETTGTSCDRPQRPVGKNKNARVPIREKELDNKIQELNNLIARETTREKYIYRLERDINDLKRGMAAIGTPQVASGPPPSSVPAPPNASYAHGPHVTIPPTSYQHSSCTDKIHSLEKENLVLKMDLQKQISDLRSEFQTALFDQKLLVVELQSRFNHQHHEQPPTSPTNKICHCRSDNYNTAQPYRANSSNCMTVHVIPNRDNQNPNPTGQHLQDIPSNFQPTPSHRQNHGNLNPNPTGQRPHDIPPHFQPPTGRRLNQENQNPNPSRRQNSDEDQECHTTPEWRTNNWRQGRSYSHQRSHQRPLWNKLDNRWRHGGESNRQSQAHVQSTWLPKPRTPQGPPDYHGNRSQAPTHNKPEGRRSVPESARAQYHTPTTTPSATLHTPRPDLEQPMHHKSLRAHSFHETLDTLHLPNTSQDEVHNRDLMAGTRRLSMNDITPANHSMPNNNPPAGNTAQQKNQEYPHNFLGGSSLTKQLP